MKTTLDLPDDLMRRIKIRAVRENRRLEDIVTELLRRGMRQPPRAARSVRRRVQLPLVDCAHDATPTEEMTPHRVAEILLEEERHTAEG